jgi:hypothetical protein
MISRKGWPYSEGEGTPQDLARVERFRLRDRALVSILYAGELRVSEALRLIKKQFSLEEDCLRVREVLLSKHHKGAVEYRSCRLPLRGERARFTRIIQQYLETLEDENRLFPWSLKVKVSDTGHTYQIKGTGEIKPIISYRMNGTVRAWQIVNAMLPEYTEHWLRAFGDRELYHAWGHDIMAVSKEVMVDPRTIVKYLQESERYAPA